MTAVPVALSADIEKMEVYVDGEKTETCVSRTHHLSVYHASLCYPPGGVHRHRDRNTFHPGHTCSVHSSH